MSKKDHIYNKSLRQRQKIRRQQHQQFKRFPYYVAKAGKALLWPYYKLEVVALEALEKVGLPLDITSTDLLKKLLAGEEKLNDELELYELSHSFELMFFENRSDCKSYVDGLRAAGDKRYSVATVGDCDEMASAQGYGAELSGFCQFMVNKEATFARLFTANHRDIKGFLKCDETGSLTPCVWLGQRDPPEGYFKERASDFIENQGAERAREYSGWVDPE